MAEKRGKEYAVPAGAKAIAILFYASAAFLIVEGIFALGFGLHEEQIPFNSEVFTASQGIVAGAVLFAFGILSILTARGLWKGKRWARILTIIVSVISFDFGLYDIITGNWISLIGVALNVIICGYLLISDSVRKAFS